jgi:hypothetical protein
MLFERHQSRIGCGNCGYRDNEEEFSEFDELLECSERRRKLLADGYVSHEGIDGYGAKWFVLTKVERSHGVARWMTTNQSDGTQRTFREALTPAEEAKLMADEDIGYLAKWDEANNCLVILKGKVSDQWDKSVKR